MEIKEGIQTVIRSRVKRCEIYSSDTLRMYRIKWIWTNSEQMHPAYMMLAL